MIADQESAQAAFTPNFGVNRSERVALTGPRRGPGIAEIARNRRHRSVIGKASLLLMTLLAAIQKILVS